MLFMKCVLLSPVSLGCSPSCFPEVGHRSRSIPPGLSTGSPAGRSGHTAGAGKRANFNTNNRVVSSGGDPVGVLES